MDFTKPIPLVHTDRGLTFEEVKQMGWKIMIPEIITSYDIFKNIIQNEETIFWIVEYNPEIYDLPDSRYSILRNEILRHPQNYIARLNDGKYRIWTRTPYEKPW